jgi:hypothetical protein
LTILIGFLVITQIQIAISSYYTFIKEKIFLEFVAKLDCVSDFEVVFARLSLTDPVISNTRDICI